MLNEHLLSGRKREIDGEVPRESETYERKVLSSESLVFVC